MTYKKNTNLITIGKYMYADKELIKYIEARYKLKKEQAEKYKPHGADRFRHILAMGEASAYKDILMALGVSVTEAVPEVGVEHSVRPDCCSDISRSINDERGENNRN